ncbi:MAG: DUF6775 family putative metallopeptidase [Thermodesulfobacteriota bacterium]
MEVVLWTDCLPAAVEIPAVEVFLRGFGFEARAGGELFTAENLDDAEFLASVRVKDFEIPLDRPARPLPEDVEAELKSVSEGEPPHKAAYDGMWFQRKIHKRFASAPPAVNIVCTGRLICTYEKRYHARVVVMGDAPSVQIVSSEGVAEGPAKPPEYYWAKGGLIQRGLADEGSESLSVLDEVFEGKFIKRSDPLLGRVFAAYCLQPVLYALAGAEFCSDPQCSLFNSHRQSEILKAQARGRLCENCLKIAGGKNP